MIEYIKLADKHEAPSKSNVLLYKGYYDYLIKCALTFRGLEEKIKKLENKSRKLSFKERITGILIV